MIRRRSLRVTGAGLTCTPGDDEIDCMLDPAPALDPGEAVVANVGGVTPGAADGGAPLHGPQGRLHRCRHVGGHGPSGKRDADQDLPRQIAAGPPRSVVARAARRWSVAGALLAAQLYFVSFTVRVTSRVLPAASTILTVIVAVTVVPFVVAVLICLNAALTAFLVPFGLSLSVAL
jgi:hypothetical protein